MQRQQTVLFVNNIIYDDPKVVQSILDGASNQTAKYDAPESPVTSGSVVNRPRPIPRKSEEGHNRTKSGGSIRSMLMSTPGSRPKLPPCRLRRRVQGRQHDLQPNDTTSMTFDEKMKLFFPAPPSGGNAANRRDSIPEMPPLPATYWT